MSQLTTQEHAVEVIHRIGIIGQVVLRLLNGAAADGEQRRVRHIGVWVVIQELRTVRVSDRLRDKARDGLIRQVAFEFIPGSDQAAGAFDLQVQERPQCAANLIADGLLPTHQEALGMAELLEGTMVALDAPVLTLHVAKVALDHLHALFFRGSYCA